MVVSGNCSFYDFGSEKMNMMKYNQTKPPVFYAKDIKTPVTLFAAQNDFLAVPTVNYSIITSVVP